MDKKAELKKILKPLIKEAVKEVLMEQGLINILKETLQTDKQLIAPQIKVPLVENLDEKKKLEALENRKIMIEEINKSGYLNSGFNPFANTNAIESNTLNEVKIDPHGPLKGLDPNDPGVDISGLISNMTSLSALTKRKGK